MKNLTCLILVVLMISGIAGAQEQYPKFYQAGARINVVPEVNVYLITEKQFDKTLSVNEQYKNCEQRIELLKIKISQQDSIITLHQAKASNYDSTLTHTRGALNLSMDESQSCQKELAKQKICKKRLLGIAGLEAVILILVIAL